jgi:hypothetical protein
MTTETKEPQNQATITAAKQKPLRLPVFFGFLALAVLAIIVELLLFPNLAGNLFFLTIVVATSLLSFISLGLSLSGLRARMPVAAKWAVSLALWGFVALAVIFLLLPNFISTPPANDADPFAKPIAQTTVGAVTAPGNRNGYSGNCHACTAYCHGYTRTDSHGSAAHRDPCSGNRHPKTGNPYPRSRKCGSGSPNNRNSSSAYGYPADSHSYSSTDSHARTAYRRT